ncbi:MAG: hypothetical protein MRY74_08660 [Neomegalonema sp.]|nr:hypothetical protein [Neomegalonema sp.]
MVKLSSHRCAALLVGAAIWALSAPASAQPPVDGAVIQVQAEKPSPEGGAKLEPARPAPAAPKTPAPATPDAKTEAPATDRGTETPPTDKPSDADAGARQLIGAEEFRRLFEGKTAHLREQSGVYYGSEQFLPGDRSVWTLRGETCQDGVWTHTAERQYCFTYGADGPHCWFMYRRGGKLYAESTGGLVLEIFKVDRKPVGCQADRLS